MEIERKFLVKNPPFKLVNGLELIREPYNFDLTLRGLELISQAYIFDSDGTCMRVRKQTHTLTPPLYESSKQIHKYTEEYLLTIKQMVNSNVAKTAVETEIEIPMNVFNALLKEKYGNIIYKERFLIDYMWHTIEIDAYKGSLEGLITAEVEFKNEEDAINFVVPEWFSKEVTFDKKYTNANLAKINSLKELQDNIKVKKLKK